MTSIQGKAALVIGASSGVGRASVRTLIAAGARVAAVARGADLAVLPRQLIANTEFASAAADAYSATLGITSEQHMKRFGTPLTVEAVAAAIMGGLLGQVAPGVNAIGVSGESVEPLA